MDIETYRALRVGGCLWLTLVTWFMIALGSILIHNGKLIDALTYQQTSHVNQVARDWSETPFVNLTVTGDTYCPEGQQAVFERVWYG